MKKQRTHYQLIVDRSGSMSDCIDATINGFNEQLNRIRAMEREFQEQDIRIGLTLFNHEVIQLHTAVPVNEIPPLTKNNYIPNSNTALLDAIGKTTIMLSDIQNISTGIPTTFVVVVLTDGYENSSRFFTLENIRSLINKLEATGKWTFSFIGATLDAVDIAQQMAIKKQNSFQYNKADMQGAVWDKLSDSMHRYFDKKDKNQDTSNLFD